MDMQFEEIYEQFFKDVYLYIFALSRDPHLAEDITQETFFQSNERAEAFPRRLFCQIVAVPDC